MRTGAVRLVLFDTASCSLSFPCRVGFTSLRTARLLLCRSILGFPGEDRHREEKSMEKEAKKEAFRKYLESSGVLDVLTKALVALYEEDNRPSSATEFIQQKLGGPTIAEYEKLQAEKSDLQLKYDELLATYKDTCKELEELKAGSNSYSRGSTT